MANHTDDDVAAWIADAMPAGTDTPCGHYLGSQGRLCGQTPTRQYLPGRRCYEHRLIAIRRVHDAPGPDAAP